MKQRLILSKRFFLFCSVLPSMLLCAFGDVSQTTSSDLVWAADGPKLRIGQDDPGRSPDAYVDAPKIVIDAAQRVLGGKPSEWFVEHELDHLEYLDTDAKTGPKEVVWISREDKNFICLVEGHHWEQLNTPQSLPFISQIVSSMIDLPVEH